MLKLFLRIFPEETTLLNYITSKPIVTFINRGGYVLPCFILFARVGKVGIDPKC